MKTTKINKRNHIEGLSFKEYFEAFRELYFKEFNMNKEFPYKEHIVRGFYNNNKSVKFAVERYSYNV